MSDAISKFIGDFDAAMDKVINQAAVPQSAQQLASVTSAVDNYAVKSRAQRYAKIKNLGGGAYWFDAFMYLCDKYYLKSRELDDYARGVLTKAQPSGGITVWYEKLLDYESRKGLADGSPHPSFGFNAPFLQKYGIAVPATLDEAKKAFEATVLPRVSAYAVPIQAQMGDFLFNTGKDARIYLLAQRNLIPAAKRIAFKDAMKDGDWTDKTLEAEFNAAWTASGIDLSNPTAQDISDMKQGRDFYYKNTDKVGGNPNPAYFATWQGRVTLYDNIEAELQQTASAASSPTGTGAGLAFEDPEVQALVATGATLSDESKAGLGTSSTKMFTTYRKFKYFVLDDGQKTANSQNDPGMTSRMATGYVENLAASTGDDKDLLYLAFLAAGDNYKGPNTDKIANPKDEEKKTDTTNTDADAKKFKEVVGPQTARSQGEYEIFGDYTFELSDPDTMKVIGPSGSIVSMIKGGSDLGELVLVEVVDGLADESFKDGFALVDEFDAVDEEYIEIQQYNQNVGDVVLRRDFPTNPYEGQVYTKSDGNTYVYNNRNWIRLLETVVINKSSKPEVLNKPRIPD